MAFDAVKVALGSQNEAKMAGVYRAFGEYWESVEVESVVPPEEDTQGRPQQPVSWQEIGDCLEKRLKDIQKTADSDYDYYVALESGIICDALDYDAKGLEDARDTGVIDLSMAAIHDTRSGKTFYGVSPSFVIPSNVLQRMIDDRLELADAFKKEYSLDAKKRGGVIGPLSLQRIRRTDFEYLGVLMALWQIVFVIDKESQK